MTYDFAGGGMGTQQGINSPWDLTAEGSTVYVAMAGTHQIWRVEMPIGFARALAGTGRENIVDGPTERAACAQPSGICAVGGNLYFADSEASAIRGIDMAAERVFTVIGQGLFVFGDVDGAHPEARFQHPLGVTAYGNELLVADTYNHKIKLVEPTGRSARTLFGDGTPGAAAPDGAVRFNEPGGLHAVGDALFVADTNNHRVVTVNVKTGQWAELTIDGLTSTATTMDADAGDVIQAGEIAVAPDKPIELSLNVALPAGAHLNADAPWSVRVTAGDRTVVQQTGVGGALPIKVTVPAGPTRAPDRVSECWRVTLAAAYCTDGDAGLCAPVHVIWQAGIRRDAAGRDRIALDTLRGEGH